jgi:hypothetical protein
MTRAVSGLSCTASVERTVQSGVSCPGLVSCCGLFSFRAELAGPSTARLGGLPANQGSIAAALTPRQTSTSVHCSDQCPFAMPS